MLWVFLTVAAVGLFWYGYRHPYRRRWLLPRPAVAQTATSAVDRQHRHIQEGGLVGESAVAATATHFDELLRAGRAAEVERELQPGVGFAVQVRALTAVGTPEAGRVLERQLGRSLVRDPVEQTWYWADVAAGLRHLHHIPALPAVLRCADEAAGLPAGTVLAVEAVAFPNFPTALNDLTSPVGRAATRAMVAVARGCRERAVDPECLLRVGLGSLLAALSETAPTHADPWLTAALLEAERLSRRCRHWAGILSAEGRELAEAQGTRLRDCAARRLDWLAGAPARLLGRFTIAAAEEQRAILQCALEFGADVTALFPHLPERRSPVWQEAVRCLTWSQSPVAGAVLAGQVSRWLASRRGQHRAIVLLAALRGHPCPEAETALLHAANAAAPVRVAAVSALGWWPPFDPDSVMRVLRVLRTDPDDATRLAAASALARLGERAALAEVRAGLNSEEPAVRLATIDRVAREELSWLWPDLQELIDCPDAPIALAAVEAVERLREANLGPLG
jgi:hypothetical protein